MPFKVISKSFAQDRFNLVIPRPAVVLVPVVYAMCGIAFLFDLTRDNTLAFGIFYAPLVATSVVNGSWGKLWWLTALALAMVVVGAFFPVVNSDLPDLIGNRLLSVIAVLATTACAYHARRIQERLAEETRRAEAAERIKTDVLTNLAPRLDLMIMHEGNSISHNLRTVVLDPNGIIYHQFDGNEWTPKNLADAVLQAAILPAKP